MTNFQRFTFTLTAVNLILLAFGVAQLRPAIAQEVAPHFVLGHWKSWMTRGGFARRSRYFRHNRRSGCPMARRDTRGGAIAPDQFAEQSQREARDDRRRIGVGAGRRTRPYAITVAPGRSFHQDRDRGRPGTNGQTLSSTVASRKKGVPSARPGRHRTADSGLQVRRSSTAATSRVCVRGGRARARGRSKRVDLRLRRRRPDQAVAVQEPSRLFTVFGTRPDASTSQKRGGTSYRDFLDWRERGTQAFRSLAAYDVRAGFTLTTSEGPERVSGLRVSSGFFDTLGVRPVP